MSVDMVVTIILTAIPAILFFVYALKISKMQLPQFEQGDPDSIEQWKKFKIATAVIMGFAFLSIIPAVGFITYHKNSEIPSGDMIIKWITAHPILFVGGVWMVFFLLARVFSIKAHATGVTVKATDPYSSQYTPPDNTVDSDASDNFEDNDDDSTHLDAVAAWNTLLNTHGVETIMMGASHEDFATFVSELSHSSAFTEEEILTMMYTALTGSDDDMLHYAAFLFESGRFYEALPLLQSLASKGIADAQYFLGCMYHDGSEVEKNTDTALTWFSKAAAQGHCAAINNLAWMYKEGKQVTQDYKKAFELLKESASQNDPWALNELGEMYENGLGTDPDSKKAVECYTKAVEREYVPAFFSLGNIYYKGEVVPKDDVEAVKWFTIMREYRECRDAAIIEAILEYEDSLSYETLDEGRERAYEWLEEHHSEEEEVEETQ